MTISATTVKDAVPVVGICFHNYLDYSQVPVASYGVPGKRGIQPHCLCVKLHFNENNNHSYLGLSCLLIKVTAVDSRVRLAGLMYMLEI